MISLKERMIFECHSVYINPTSDSDIHKDVSACGTLRICENQYGPYLFWQRNETINKDGEWDFIHEAQNIGKLLINDIQNKNDNINNSSSENDIVPKKVNGLRIIRFELFDLKCYRSISTKSMENISDSTTNIENRKSLSKELKPPYFVFILKDGTTYPPLQFTNCQDSDKFVECILKYLEIKRSYKENDMYIVKDHRAIALEKSFNELDLFGDKTEEDIVSKFIKDPYTTTFNGFSKVAKLVYDTLTIPQPPIEDVTLLIDQFNQTLNDNSQGSKTRSVVGNRPHRLSNNHPLSSTNSIHLTPAESDFQLINCNEIPYRPEIERGPALTKSEWLKCFDPNSGRVNHPQTIKHHIFKGGVSPEIRKDVWKYLLNYYPWDSTTEQRTQIIVKKKREDYYRMKLQWKSIDDEQERNFTKLRERKSLIEKDVHRTDRTHPYFQGDKNAHLNTQYDILMTYTMLNFDIGYVQGMSDLLTPIQYVMDDEVDAFWVFANYMDRMQNNFHMDQEAMKLQLIQLYNLLAFVDPQYAIYLDRHDSGNMYFCFRWLLILFKREFTFKDILKIWEVIWTDLPCKNFHLLICVALLEEEKHTITENRFGLTEILKHINDIANTIDLDKILRNAEAIWYQIKECRRTISPKISEILGFTT